MNPSASTIAGDLRTDDDASRWLGDMLAPEGATGPAHRRVERYLALPSAARPRYLLPVDQPRAAAAAIRAGHGRGLQQAARVGGRGLIGLGALKLLRSRSVPIPAGDPARPSLREWLVSRLDAPASTQDGLGLAVTLGPPRPNRKPILQLVDSGGNDVAFAKMATDDHTAALVATEADFLRRHRLGGIDIPELLFESTWKGHPLAVLSALPLPRRLTRARLVLTAGVVRAIAGHDGLGEHRATDSRWWQRVQSRSAAAPPGLRAPVATAVEAVGRRLDGSVLTFGAWHGDLTPWNATWSAGRFLVWDWERTDAPVPLGIDVVHNAFSGARHHDQLDVAPAADRAGREAAGLLEAVGVAPNAIDHVVDCYLLELLLRLVLDAAHGDLGPANQNEPEQLVDAIVHRSASLSGPP